MTKFDNHEKFFEKNQMKQYIEIILAEVNTDLKSENIITKLIKTNVNKYISCLIKDFKCKNK